MFYEVLFLLVENFSKLASKETAWNRCKDRAVSTIKAVWQFETIQKCVYVIH
jgi:hypothetical protein